VTVMAIEGLDCFDLIHLHPFSKKYHASPR
jgi:hypothetical protein